MAPVPVTPEPRQAAPAAPHQYPQTADWPPPQMRVSGASGTAAPRRVSNGVLRRTPSRGAQRATHHGAPAITPPRRGSHRLGVIGAPRTEPRAPRRASSSAADSVGPSSSAATCDAAPRPIVQQLVEEDAPPRRASARLAATGASAIHVHVRATPCRRLGGRDLEGTLPADGDVPPRTLRAGEPFSNFVRPVFVDGSSDTNPPPGRLRRVPTTLPPKQSGERAGTGLI